MHFKFTKVTLHKPKNNVSVVKIEYESSEQVRITDLRIFFDEIDENPLNILNDSWKLKSNDQLIETTGSIELTEIECPANSIVSFAESSTKSPEPSPAWGQWGSCSGSCGNGTRFRSRKCIGGTDNSCDGEGIDYMSCQITCAVIDAQVTEQTTAQSIEALDGGNQAVLNCRVFDHERVFMFSNGISFGCETLGSGWHFPPSTFNGNVSSEIEEFWIGASFKDGIWTNDQNEEIDAPVYDRFDSKILPRMFLIPVTNTPVTTPVGICLYWKDGYIRSDRCDATKPVVCCQALPTALDQGKKDEISYSK